MSKRASDYSNSLTNMFD